MSIATELQNYADGLDDAYDAVNDMSGIIPQHKNMNNLDQAIRTIPQNSGITATTFHWGGSPNYSMYKDSGYTTAATYSDIATAYADGLVYIADGEDEVTYVVVSDIPDAHTITVTGIGLPDYEGGSTSYAYASSTWTKTATEFQKKLTAGTNIQINGTTISATDTTYSAFTGATSSVAGTAGLVPAPTTSDPDKFLKGDGTWGTPADTGGVLIGYVAAAHTVIGGGGSNFYVFTDTTYSTFVTVADVKNALAAGKNVYFKFNDGDYYLKILSQISASSFQVSFDGNTIATMATSGADAWDIGGVNFPTIPTNTSDLTNDGSDGTSTYVEADELATVATSGSYNDLLNTPTIPAAQIQSDWTQADNTKLDYIKNKPSLAAVATSGAYSDLTGTPTIPAAQVQSNWTQTTTTAVDYIKNKPAIRHLSSVSDAGWSADADKLVDGSVLAYWNGAYSGTASNLKYFANSSVTTNNLQGSAVTNAKIADNTIEMGKIKWSTMCSAFSGTTDGNGFIAVPTGTVKPTTGFILGARRVKNNDTGQTDGILLPYTDHSQSRYTLKFINWNMQANGNQTIKVEIVYCLKSV